VYADEVVAREPVEAEDGEVQRQSTAELVLPLTGAGWSIRSTAELVAVDAVERKGLVERRVQRLANHTCLHLATATRQRL